MNLMLETLQRDVARQKMQKQLSGEKSNFWEDLVKSLAEASEDKQWSKAWDIMKMISRSRRPGLWRQTNALRLALEDGGTTLSTERDEKDAMMKHFASIEHSEVGNVEDLVAKHNQGELVQPETLEEELIPTITKVQEIISTLKTGKAAGIDGIGADFLKVDPQSIARLLHPLLVKISFQCQAPLSYKGGALVSFWKGKGSVKDLRNQRAILLTSILSKIYERSVYDSLDRAVVKAAPDSMCGGMRGRGTDFPAHMARELLWEGRAKNTCTTLLFIDAR